MDSRIYAKFSELPYGHFSAVPVTKHIHLHILLLDCGRGSTRSCQYKYDGLKRSKGTFSTLQFTICGHGCLDYEGQSYLVYPGQIMLLNIPHQHIYYCDGETPWNFIYLTLAGRETHRIINKIIALHTKPVFDLNLEGQQILSSIFTQVFNKKSNEFLLSASVYQLLMQIAKQRCYPRTNAGIPAPLRHAMMFCEQHYKDINLDIDAMAHVACISRSQLFRLFNQHTGKSPNDFLQEVRLNNAKKIINECSLSLEQIADDCGFSSASYLGKVFKKHFGSSPGRYKKRNIG